jgi:hypothetical protein
MCDGKVAEKKEKKTRVNGSCTLVRELLTRDGFSSKQ